MTNPNISSSALRKVLLIRLSSLGDVVLATSAITPFANSGWEIHFATKSAFAPLLASDARLKSVYRYDAKAGGESSAREGFLKWCAAEKFDLILDLHDSLRTRFWRNSLRQIAPVRVAKKERLREFLILVFRLGKWLGFGAGGRTLKLRELAEEALQEWDSVKKGDDSLTALSVAKDAQQKTTTMVPDGDFIVLLPGSAWAGKKWPFFSELAKRAAALAPVVVLGGEKDSDCEEIAQNAKAINAKSCSLATKTSIAESMAVIQRAALVVANDTGMAHVAEALGRPLIVLEGPTDPSMGFSVHRKSSEVLGLDLACRPCSKSGKICWRWGSRKCLTDLSVDFVWSQLASRWEKRC